MTNEIISLVLGAVAPFVLKTLNKLGLKGVGMLWASYAVSVVLAVILTVATGKFEVADVAQSVTLIVATSQTVFHVFKDKIK